MFKSVIFTLLLLAGIGHSYFFEAAIGANWGLDFTDNYVSLDGRSEDMEYFTAQPATYYHIRAGFSPFDFGANVTGNIFAEVGYKNDNSTKTITTYGGLFGKTSSQSYDYKTDLVEIGIGYSGSWPHLLCAASVGIEMSSFDSITTTPYFRVDYGFYISSSNPRNYSGVEITTFMKFSSNEIALGVLFGLHYNGGKDRLSDAQLEEDKQSEQAWLLGFARRCNFLSVKSIIHEKRPV